MLLTAQKAITSWLKFISAKCGANPTILDYDGHLHLQGTFNDVITDCHPAQMSQAPTETGIVSYKTWYAY